LNKEKILKRIHELENKAKIRSIKNHLNEYKIDIRINSLDDFYDHFDVDVPETRDLNPELENYLLKEVEKIDYLPNLKVHIHCPAHFELPDELIRTACVNHFEELSVLQFHQNRLYLKKWLLKIVWGTFFLGGCLLISNFLHYPQFEARPFFKVLSESFSIIGWVAIWEPACYLLYYRREDKEKLKDRYILHSADYVIERT